jgi:predicted O-methyltransferase YrrM
LSTLTLTMNSLVVHNEDLLYWRHSLRQGMDRLNTALSLTNHARTQYVLSIQVGAYLTQELGFTNVSRLAAGIIGYDRTLQENQVKDSMFKGTNFVFDGRLGRPITEDALGTCFTCGAETSLICNCRNNNCHKRITQCEQCRTAFRGTCSDACRQRLVNGMMAPRRGSGEVIETTRPTGTGKESYATLEAYSSGFSSPLPPVYEELILNTRALIPTGSHMVSGGAQGRLLTQLASMTREGRILELGTFSGYATACLLEGAINVAANTGLKCGCREKGPYVMTLERDAKAFEVAVRHIEAIASKGYTKEARDALAMLRDPSFISAPSRIESSIILDCAGVATCELVRVSDALAAVEELAVSGRDRAPAPFDLVFVDADKTRLYDYVDVFLSSDLLKRGGLIVVDNVLYKGLVLEAAGGEFPSLQDSDDDTDAMLRKNRRQRRLASKMHRFNEAIVSDERAEVTILPLRDGLSVIRKR